MLGETTEEAERCCLKPFNVAKIRGLPVGLIVSICVTADATRS